MYSWRFGGANIVEGIHSANRCDRLHINVLIACLYVCTVADIIVSMIRKYHNTTLQTTPWHREEEPLNHHEKPGRQIKQSNQLALPHQDDCNTRMDIN